MKSLENSCNEASTQLVFLCLRVLTNFTYVREADADVAGLIRSLSCLSTSYAHIVEDAAALLFLSKPQAMDMYLFLFWLCLL